MVFMESESVKVVAEGAVPEIVINRLEALNALNVDVLQGLCIVFGKLCSRSDVRAVIITGAGEKSFVAGADIATMSELGPRAIADYIELGQRTMRTIESAPFPVIAAVNGYALGGGLELALACDLIVASAKAKIGQPEVNLGIIPGFGGTQRLIQRCGVGPARRLCYTGAIIEAEEALRLGIVDTVVEPSEVLSAARTLAETIATRGPCAVRGVKRVIRESQEQVLLSGLRREAEEFLSLFQTSDREEGMQAFLQKRGAAFKGR
jgi:enoyl-CoA hydratase